MGVSKKVTLDKDQKYTIGYSFKNKMGISVNNFVLLELIKDGSIMYTRKLQATEATTFDYTAPATGEYTWRMRSSSIGTTTTQPLTYSLDNLSIFYTYSYTIENCDNLADGYRFGFNGKENDMETLTQDYGFRIYNPGLGRFLSVDPLTKDYPSWSPYPFAMNRPIDGIDIDGAEWKSQNKWTDKITNEAHIKILGDKYVEGMKYIEAWRAVSPEMLKEKIGVKIDCADLAIETLVKFAFDFKLTIHFEDYKVNDKDPTFNNNYYGFTNSDGSKVVFKEGEWKRMADNIKAKYGAADVFNNNKIATTKDHEKVKACDLMTWRHGDGGFHTQTVIEVSRNVTWFFGLIKLDDKYTTIQGNLNGGKSAPAREKEYSFNEVNSRKGETIKGKSWNFRYFDSKKHIKSENSKKSK